MKTSTAQKKVTPTGLLVLSADAPREEWLRARRIGIAATDVVAIMGLSKYRTAFDVWTDKVMEPDLDSSMSEAALWGTRLEEPVAREWADRHGFRLRRIGLIQNGGVPWAIASLDRLVSGCPDGRCGLEVKTRNLHVADQWEKSVPVDVLAQVRWQLFVSGLDHIHVAALIGGQRMVEHVVHRDPVHEVQIFDAARIVFEAIENREVPDLPPELWTTDFLEARHPSRGGAVEIDPAVNSSLVEYASLSAKIKELTEARESVRAQLIGSLGDAEDAMSNGRLVYSYRASSTRRLSSKAVQEKYPEIKADPEVWSESTTRVLRVY